MRLLVVEDEPTIVQALKKRLRAYYVVDGALTGRQAIHLAHVYQYDLIILDLCLPDIDGIDVCRQLRTEKINMPILVLTGESAIDDRVLTLDAGADDYLTKPFHSSELLARIRALLRRSIESDTTNQLTVADLVVDPAKRLVVRGKKIIELRRKQYDLLEYLVRNKDKVLRREMILEHVWQDDTNVYSNIVDVHIKFLRDCIDKPFDKPLIKTVYGFGYKIESAKQGGNFGS